MRPVRIRRYLSDPYERLFCERFVSARFSENLVFAGHGNRSWISRNFCAAEFPNGALNFNEVGPALIGAAEELESLRTLAPHPALLGCQLPGAPAVRCN